MSKANHYVLGIHNSHNCGATLVKDGRVIASICEERLTRHKNEAGHPALSVAEVLREGGVAAKDLAGVAMASNFTHSAAYLSNVIPWYRVGAQDQKFDREKETAAYQKHIFELRHRERIDAVVNQLGVSEEKISFFDHHHSHAAAAYFGSPWSLEEDILVLTCDGSGDGLCATVSVGSRGVLKRISATPRAASLGKIYSRVTYLMGMKPWEHEYKVMGLAPYADAALAERAKSVFAELIDLSSDGLAFRVKGDLDTSYCYEFLRERLENHRFDGIAGGVQAFTEELLLRWVRACVAKTGIRKVACGGGVFMNVKANMLISELQEVDDLFVFPSCADESLSIGAAYQACFDAGSRDGAVPEKAAFDQIYLGPEYGDAAVEEALSQSGVGAVAVVERPQDIAVKVADELAANGIVARFSGRMEWGARALGNRSILAHPGYLPGVRKINSMIKMRDFWMPFAPSVLEECVGDYFLNSKNIASPFMMTCFHLKTAEDPRLAAVVHPSDGTARVQAVSLKSNPDYHRVISCFRERTGVGAVLNTSFNLHGYPIVCSPADAIDVFMRSGLECLALGKFFLRKR